MGYFSFQQKKGGSYMKKLRTNHYVVRKGFTGRLLALLLAGILITAAFPVSVFATEESMGSSESSDGTTFEIPEDDSVTEAGFNSEEEYEIVPDGLEPSQENTEWIEKDTGDNAADRPSEETYIVTLDANGGYFDQEWDDLAGGYVVREELLHKTLHQGDSIDVVPHWDQGGTEKLFLGWSTDRDGEPVNPENDNLIFSEGCVFYAIWVDPEEAIPAEAIPEEAADSFPESIQESVLEQPDPTLNEWDEALQNEPMLTEPAQETVQEQVEPAPDEGLLDDPLMTEPVQEQPASSLDESLQDEPLLTEPAQETVQEQIEPAQDEALQEEALPQDTAQAGTEGDTTLRIISQPADVEALYGTNVPFEVEAEGTGLTYQWYYRDNADNGDPEWYRISGQKKSLMFVYLDAGWDGRSIMCRVEDGTGLQMDTAPASITVLPDISSYTSTVEKNIGETVTLSVDAKGRDLTYQWYYRMPGDTDWILWEGMTHSEESVVIKEEYDGMYFNCVVTAGNGHTISTYEVNRNNFYWSGGPHFSIKAPIDPAMEEYTLYSIKEANQEYLSLPEDKLSSLSLKGHTYKILSGDTITIEEDIVRPKEEVMYYHQDSSGYWVGSSSPGGQEGEITQREVKYGDTTVRIDDEKNITFHSVSYEDEYARGVADRYLSDNINDSMTDYEKAEQCCRFVAGYDYGVESSGMTGMILTGSGDCWASTDTLLYMLEKLGISAQSHYAGNTEGAGSGHYNVVAKLDGLYYILEAGYVGTAPRKYTLSGYGSIFSYISVSYPDKTIKITGCLELDHDTSIEVPSEIDGKTVVGISKGGLSGLKHIKEITLPNTLRFIENNAFEDDYELQDITIPSGVETLGETVFKFCRSLKTVNIPASVQEIGDDCFFACYALTDIYVENENARYTSEDGVLFDKEMIRLIAYPPGKKGNYRVPEGVTELAKCSFNSANLDSLTLPQTLRTIRTSALCYSCIPRLSLPEGLTEIGEWAFRSADIRTLRLPDTIQTIGKYAFYKGSLQEINLPDGLVSIGEAAFAGNISLSRLIIPSSVNEIGDYAFYLDYGWSSMGGSQSAQQKNCVLFEAGCSPVLNGNNIFHACIIGALSDSSPALYAGEHDILFLETDARNKIKLQNAWFESLKDYSRRYSQKEIRPEVTASSGEGACPLRLLKDTDYLVSYDNNINAGEAHAVVRGIGVFSGSTTLPFTISQEWQSDAEAEIVKSRITIGHKTQILTKNTIGTISYSVSKEQVAAVDDNGFVTGKATGSTWIYVIASGDQNYEKRTLIVSIDVLPEKHEWDSGTITLEPTCTSDGIQTFSCTECQKKMTKTIPAKGHSFGAWKIVKQATYQASGLKEQVCSHCGEPRQETIPALPRSPIAKAAVTGISARTWSGKALIQNITLKYGGKTLKKGTDYTLSYSGNNNVGTASVLISGKGAYTGTVKKTFKINPKGTALRSVSGNTGALTVKWNLQKTQTTGYQIQYSSRSDFKTQKIVTVSRNTTSSQKIKGLAKKHKYYIRIRTYKKVNGKNYYSVWSNAKTQKTR